MKKTAFTYASRQEIDVELQCFEGTIPDDLSGYVYINSPVGTVNYETPIPRENLDGSWNIDFGQQIFNGDGMILRFDCNTTGKMRLKTGLMRTPCFYADLNSKIGTKYYDEGLRFKSHGLSRISSKLGTRNQVNTSISGFKFGEGKSPRLTANFDAGRPFEFDPVSLEVITPIGYNRQWRAEFPRKMDETFEMFQSTAHPSFDPLTQEYFTVCFLKSAANLAFSEKWQQILDAKWDDTKDFMIGKFDDFYKDVLEGLNIKEGSFFDVLGDFMDYLKQQREDPSLPNYSKEQMKALLFKDNFDEKDLLGMQNAVKLMRWKGTNEIEEWNVIDEEGNNIVINQTMHQTSLSEDYIVLMDTSIKFSLDIIENRFGTHNAWLNQLIRWITSKTIEPNTPMYIVHRADLVAGNKNIIAKKLIIDLEISHFSLEYSNPDDLITMYASHNSALCAAEWVRHYDTLAINNEPVHDNTIGLMICGEMDISRVGKWKIDGKTATIKDSKVVYQKGFEGNDAKNLTEAHTWAVGLSTFRHIISSRNVTNTIPYMFWQFYGLDYRMLTNFIVELYSDYEHRIIPVEDLLAYNKQGVPFCLSRQNMETMEFEDWYNFKMNQNLRSLQFVPRKTTQTPKNVEDEAKDGYILCTMINGNEDFSGDEYSREVWIFDAQNLKKGPICKLSHPDMQYAFTIHSAWIEACQPSPKDYVVDVVEDYLEVVEQFESETFRNEIKGFLVDAVFPYYKKSGVV